MVARSEVFTAKVRLEAFWVVTLGSVAVG